MMKIIRKSVAAIFIITMFLATSGTGKNTVPLTGLSQKAGNIKEIIPDGITDNNYGYSICVPIDNDHSFY